MICENCGKLIEDVKDLIVSVKNTESINIVCRECAKGFGHCPMCQHNTPCGFFNDPDPMPQFIMRTWRNETPQGVQIVQRQVPNTERIKKFCTDGKCKCFLNDPEHPLCCRIGGCATCTNYCELEQYKFVQDFPMQEAVQN